MTKQSAPTEEKIRLLTAQLNELQELSQGTHAVAGLLDNLLLSIGAETRNIAENARRVVELATLNKIGQELSSASTLQTDAILQLVHKRVSLLMDAHNFHAAFYEVKTNTVSFPFVVDGGRPRRPSKNWSVRTAGKGLEEWIINHRQPLRIDDVDEWLSAHRDEASPIGRPAKSWLGVPLIAGDSVLGVIAVQNYQAKNCYDEDDSSVLATVASQAAIAISNARLFNQAQAELSRRVDELEALAAVDGAITTGDLDVVLARILEAVRTIVRVPHVGILLADESGEYLELKASCGTEPVEGVPTRFRIGDSGVTGLVAKTRQTVLIDDVRSSEWQGVYVGLVPDTLAELAVPMLDREKQLLGVINLESPEVRGFSPDDKSLVEAFALQAVIAILMVRALEQERRARKALQDEQMKALALERTAVMGSLAANFTHRLANDLGAIPVSVQEIRRNLPADWPKRELVLRYLDRIETDAVRVLEPAKRLRIRRYKPEPKDIADVNSLLSTALREATVPEQVRIIPEYDPSLPRITTDSLLMIEVFKNLIDNAMRAMGGVGTLKVETRMRGEAGEWIEARVADTGSGIPKSLQEKIFEPFVGKGLGFGLSWSKTVLQYLGGDIVLESSAEGVGSTFCVRIPRGRVQE